MKIYKHKQFLILGYFYKDSSAACNSLSKDIRQEKKEGTKTNYLSEMNVKIFFIYQWKCQVISVLPDEQTSADECSTAVRGKDK